MKVLLFGKSGQVATEIIRRAGATEIEAHGRDSADFTDPAACAALVEATDAEAVINAVAYTAVDKAEAEPELAQMINATTPGAIARAAARRDLPVVQISTDYVFDGSGNAPWSVDAPSGPLGVYGASKRAGERALREAGGPYAILRTSWVFSAHGANFVKTMLRLGAERDGLKIVADQIGGPTPAAAIADACLAIARGLAVDPSRSGSYHFSGAPDTSWAGFARAIFEDAGLTCAVTEIPSTDYPTPARRPLNSRLDCSLTESVFGIIRPDWRAGLGDVLDELGAKV